MLTQFIEELRGRLNAMEAELLQRSGESEAARQAYTDAVAAEAAAEDRSMSLQANLEALRAALQAEKDARFQETAILTQMLEAANNEKETRFQEMATLTQRLEVANSKNADLLQYNEELLASTSWKITAPIRRVKNVLLLVRRKR